MENLPLMFEGQGSRVAQNCFFLAPVAASGARQRKGIPSCEHPQVPARLKQWFLAPVSL